jgi:hypothetical protein
VFNFFAAHDWKWPKTYTKPIVFVDGTPVLPGEGVRTGSLAYVVTVNEKTIESALSRIDVEALYLYEFRVPDLKALSHLSRLKHLRIDWSTKLIDISALKAFPDLETLHFDDTPKLDDISSIAELSRLKGFWFQGGMWNRNTVKSLEPLCNLMLLEEISLANLKVLEGGLRPLSRCPRLKKLEVSNQFETDDYAYLAGVRPDVECDMFTAWTDGIEERVMVTGRRKPFLHPIKDVDRLKAFEAKFDALRSKYAAEIDHPLT